ncbi:MAG TPA: thiolase family protein [Candidatus Dormibacteraeota bacterium]|nr:thiolase family protein [Candidatus Dormibacteraeota bacterium]
MSRAAELEHRCVISGIGRSQTGRRIDRDALDLTVDACLAAVADAGLRTADVDGLITWPGEMAGSLGRGFAGPGCATIQDTLRLSLDWYLAGGEGFNVLGSVIAAAQAVASGFCRHVLLVRTLTEATAQGAGGRQGYAGGRPGRVGGSVQWQAPFGSMSAANWAAWQAQIHFDRYGMTRETLGAIAVNQRRNAMLNEAAIYRTPLSLDDYMSARMISTPLCLFDCDVPADGSIAVVMSTVDHAPDVAGTAIAVEALGAALHGRALWEQREDMATMRAWDAAAQMWSRTDLTPGDVDFAQLYDGFSIFTAAWLEALGLCGEGEAKDFIGDGARISLQGELPVNTSGGQLSEGRFVGWGLLYEACLQLRGGAGERQIPKADVGVVGAGGGNVGQAILLRRHG